MRRQRKERVTVSARTMKRRARKHQAEETAKEEQKKAAVHPETEAQARVWDRKLKRYEIAGLCHTCAAQAAWGHALGFGKIKDPCERCQPIVNALPNSGPRGSKWRKCLLRLETMPAEAVKELLEA